MSRIYIYYKWWISEATLFAQDRICFFISVADRNLEILSFDEGETSGLFTSHDSDKYGLMICCFSSSSFSSPSMSLSPWSIICVFPSLCKPGTRLIIRGLISSFLNSKPRSIKPFTSSSSSSLSVLQLMDFCSFPFACFLNFLLRPCVFGDGECDPILFPSRLSFLLGVSSFSCFLIETGSPFVAVRIQNKQEETDTVR